MQKPKIDRNRLDVLKSIAVREKAALQAAQDEVSAAIDRSNAMHREIQSLRRQIERAPGENLQLRLQSLTADKKAIDEKIEELHQNVEFARERSNAAKRLNNRCVEFASGHAEISQ